MLAQFNPDTIERLQRDLPPMASVFNPIDVIGDALGLLIAWRLAAALADPNVDAALILFTPQAGSEPELTAEVVAELAAAQSKKRRTTSYMGAASLGPALKLLNAHNRFELPIPRARDRGAWRDGSPARLERAPAWQVCAVRGRRGARARSIRQSARLGPGSSWARLRCAR